jgi:hypothetical protein
MPLSRMKIAWSPYGKDITIAKEGARRKLPHVDQHHKKSPVLVLL